MEPNELIVCRDVSLGYEGQSVLSHLDLTVQAGGLSLHRGGQRLRQVHAAAGAAGAADAPVRPDPPGAGAAAGGHRVSAPADPGPAGLSATVYEVVLSGCLNQKGLRFFYTAAQKSRALMNMGKLGILELKDKSYRDLSGGQQQRVLLARALCAAGRLLILDEPITGLDPAAAQDLYKTLSYLNRKEGMAVVMVTHDLKAALRSARTVLHIGRSSFFLGTVPAYLASPQGRRFREVEE